MCIRDRCRCVLVSRADSLDTNTPTSTRILIYRCWAVKYVNWVGESKRLALRMLVMVECLWVCARALLTCVTHRQPPEWETLWPISTGKCAGKSSVTRTSTRGNTLLPSTLTLLIGLRVTHSWGCVYVCVVSKKDRSFLLTTHTNKNKQTNIN